MFAVGSAGLAAGMSVAPPLVPPCLVSCPADRLVEENPAMLDVEGLRAAMAEAARIMPQLDVQVGPAAAVYPAARHAGDSSALHV